VSAKPLTTTALHKTRWLRHGARRSKKPPRDAAARVVDMAVLPVVTPLAVVKLLSLLCGRAGPAQEVRGGMVGCMGSQIEGRGPCQEGRHVLAL
jgi:hypothetical protein